MKTFSQVAIAMVGMTGLVAAQPKADPKAADAKAPAAAKAEPKAAAKAEPKAADAKAADTKAAGAQDESKPPKEVTDMAKAATGTWRCKGQGMDHSMKMVDMTATVKVKSDLVGWWVHATFESKMGKEPFIFEQYTTFDPTARKWRRLMIETGGNWASGESLGPKDGKVDWEMATHSPQMGDGAFREHEDFSDPKAGAKMWGELSDKGSWVKIYEIACKK